ncbi:InlB B-repeat-containing protein [Tuanshanicoccus lijuaniae]|uniref:InlB B-repeat-containing protein n=1 Tax=Aerococcaceae bacterium zg-1292 TaxID=2774330 RepID=UPI001BD88177|nr:InlB B-repeat-containing protein [Aerococcaceae bacterium zg-A91]MBS4458145.1 InlB B-repeat-containing protein [Aerococcaceae bacterium zg-BR33]
MKLKSILNQLMKNNTKRRSVTAVLALITVICTVYFLILPAITLEESAKDDVGIVGDNETTKVEEIESFQEVTTVSETESVMNESEPTETAETTVAESVEEESTVPLQDKTLVLSDAKHDMNVYVTAPKTAELPADTEVEVKDVEKHDENYYKEQLKQRFKDIDVLEVIDLSLYSQQNEVEPNDKVEVDIRYRFKYPDNVQVAHFKEDGTVEIIDAKRANEEQLVFDTHSFSVFALIQNNKEIPRHTYKFQTEDGKPFNFKTNDVKEVSEQIIKDGEQLEDVGLPAIDGERTFQGWYLYDTNTNTYGEKIDFNQPLAVSETKDFIVRPKFDDVAHATFYDDEAGTRIYRKESVKKSAEINLNDYKADSPDTKLVFAGWSKEPKGAIIPKAQAAKYKVEQDTAFYPVFKPAIKISFVTGAGNGAPIIPQKYIVAGESAVSAEPPTPVREGFIFDYWKYQNSKFDFNQVPTKDITLEAVWKPANAKYTVIYWQQVATDSVNATDAQKKYEYAGQEQRDGTAGELTAPLNEGDLRNKYTGFNFKRADARKTIDANGNTVINVYYDRQIIKMQFYNGYNPGSGSWVWNDHNYTTTYMGLYGTPFTRWPQNFNWQYYTQNNELSNMSFLGNYILPEDVLSIRGEQPQTVIRFFRREATVTSAVEFLTENLDPNTYTTVNRTPVSANRFYFSEKFTGFEVASYETKPVFGLTWSAKREARVGGMTDLYNWRGVYYDLRVYYKRKRFRLNYLDPFNDQPLSGLSSTELPYEMPLTNSNPESKAGFTAPVTTRPGYEWDGKWYEDAAMTKEFNWTTTMPPHDVKVYAGFRPKQYKVTLEANGGEINQTQFTATYGQKTSNNPIPIERNYVADPNGEYYYVDDRVNHTAFYTKTPVAGAKRYRYDPGVYTFIGWYAVQPDGRLRPYTLDTAVTRDITLRAAWRKVGEYAVVYHTEAVDDKGQPIPKVNTTNPPSDSNRYSDLSSAIVGAAASAPEDYRFMGWYYNGTVYRPNDAFTIEADAADENHKVHMLPVLKKLSDLNLTTTHLVFDSNGGTLTQDKAVIDEINNDGGQLNETKTQIGFAPLNDNGTRNALSDKVFERKGYDFIGWSLNKEAKEPEFVANQRLLITSKDDKNNVLYAVWKPKKYTVTVKKVVSGTQNDKQESFTFAPYGAIGGDDFHLKDGDVQTFEVDYGSTINVKELANEHYQVERSAVYEGNGSEIDGKEVAQQSDGSMTVEGNITMTFTNTRKTQRVAVQKVDALNQSQPLRGAVFDLYQMDEHGNKSATPYRQGLHTDAQGYILEGENQYITLPAGKYFLTETNAADGHQIAKEDAILNVGSTGVSMLYKGVETNGAVEMIGEHTVYSFKFTNEAGMELPATGGIGTWVYTLCGSLLIGFALYHLRKRQTI